MTKRKFKLKNNKLIEAWRKATKSEIEKLDRCVEKVKEKGNVKSPWAICLKSLKMKRGEGKKWLKLEQRKDTFTIKDVIKTIDQDVISVDSFVIMFYPKYKEIPVFNSEIFSFYELPHLKKEYPRTLTGIKNFINNITHSIYTLTLRKLEELGIDINLIEYINIDFDLDESDLEPLIYRKKIHEIPIEYEETEYEVPVKFKQLLEKLKNKCKE